MAKATEPRAATDVSGRPVALRDPGLDGFFHPKVVAVIGASDTGRRPNTMMWRKILAWGEAAGATVIPVNPHRTELDGQVCLASILDIPGKVDLAVILVGDAVAMFEAVLAKRPRFAVIFSAGFAEVGEEGALLQARLEALVATGSTHLLGPNTNLNAFENFRSLPGRAIALVTQSGHQGRPVFQAQDFGVRLSHWAPTGNEADLEFADFARYFADEREVGVIAAYIEGFKDGRTLMLAADHAARKRKPVVIVKVGRSAAGASMAKSHTGHLTGSDKVIDAVFRQFGITRVDGLDELTDTASMFARTQRPRAMKGGKRSRLRQLEPASKTETESAGDIAYLPDRRPGVCVYAISGGTGAHMADLCAVAGLSMPELTPKTQKLLHQWIPTYLRVSNPVDNGGPPSSDERGRKIIDAILADPNVDMVICPITGALASMSVPLSRDLVEAAATSNKPVLVVWGSPDGSDPAYTDILLPGRIPVFRTFHNCVQAAKAYFDYWDFQARYESPFAEVPMRPSPAAKKVAPMVASVTGGRALSEVDSKDVLRAYGIRTSTDVLCGSAAEASRAAERIGYPVVMKIASPDLLHKSDLGLVQVGVASAPEVKRQHAELVRKATAASKGKAQIDGVLVCEQVSGGVECVVGVSRDDLFGPVIMFGLGGVFVEVLEDVTFRVPPFSRVEAQRMVREVAGFTLLEGVRGSKPADVSALVDVIMRVQRLAMDHAGSIGEIDINPLLVLPKGKGAVALDALVIGR